MYAIRDNMMIETAQRLGVDVDLLRDARNRKIQELLCLAYRIKGNSADIRKSPALEIVEELKKAGIKNFVSYDPFVNVSAVNQVGSIEKAMDGTDCAIIATDHAIFGRCKYISLQYLGTSRV